MTDKEGSPRPLQLYDSSALQLSLLFLPAQNVVLAGGREGGWWGKGEVGIEDQIAGAVAGVIPTAAAIEKVETGPGKAVSLVGGNRTKGRYIRPATIFLAGGCSSWIRTDDAGTRVHAVCCGCAGTIHVIGAVTP